MNLKTLHKVSYGLYIICSKNDDKINGQIASVLFQITAEPPRVAISINKQNLTHEYIKKSKVFAASILSVNAPMTLIGNFGFKSGRDIDKFKDINYNIGKTKTPIVTDGSLAFVEGKVIDSIECGTHTIFIGEVVDAEVLTDEEPMTYDYYHKVKGGYSPKTAPTYYKEMDKEKNNGKEEKKMDKYICKVCGYVYDPEKGDPDGGIAPGTNFEDIPDDWVCPVCGVGKEDFEKEK